MDACTVGNIRSILIFVMIVLAAVGLWKLHDEYTCVKSADKQKCTTKAFGITAAILAAGIFFTIHANRRYDFGRSPKTSELMANIQ